MTTKEDSIDFVRSRAEAARILGISTRTLARMEANGMAPARVRITDRIVGYRQSAIDQFLAERAA